ncbi:MAG: hypothetical protein ACUVTY_12825 [Armatimonadota bacterium]
MKRTWTILAVSAVVSALALSPVLAQGRGAVRGNADGAKGLPCPYGYTQPNPNAGGWWTRVNPTTPQQKAFVEQVKALHEQIRQKQFELAQLQADSATIEAKQAEINALREQLHQLQVSNLEMKQSIMQENRGGKRFGSANGNGQGVRRRMQMRGTAPWCPYANTQ